MLKFKLLLWAMTKLLQRAINQKPACAQYVNGKELTFQIKTASGQGRHYVIRNSKVSSVAGLAKNPQFTMTFKDAASGFSILSAKDSKNAFLSGLGSGDLVLSGDFVEILWFQGLIDFLQPSK